MKDTLEFGFRGGRCWDGQGDLFVPMRTFNCVATLRCESLLLPPCTNNTDELYILALASTSTLFHHVLRARLSFRSDLLFLTDFVRGSRSPRLPFPLPHVFYNTRSVFHEGLQKVAHCWAELRQSSAKLSLRYGSPNLRSIQIQNIKIMHV